MFTCDNLKVCSYTIITLDYLSLILPRTLDLFTMQYTVIITHAVRMNITSTAMITTEATSRVVNPYDVSSGSDSVGEIASHILSPSSSTTTEQ